MVEDDWIKVDAMYADVRTRMGIRLGLIWISIFFLLIEARLYAAINIIAVIIVRKVLASGN